MTQPEPYRPGTWRIPISRPQLPPLEDYQALLGRVWDSHLLSNFSEQAMTLESRAAAYLGNPNTRVVSSCDIGLVLTIAAQRIPHGKKALIPSFTFSSTVNAAIWNGLEPVFVDLNPWDFCVDPQAILRKLHPDVGLIIGTHIFGNPCRIEDIALIAEEAGVPVVYDSAHALGSEYRGRKVGNGGENAVFSLSGTKLITSGEGGIMAPANVEIAERLAYLRAYGFIGDYNTQLVGLNGKLSELHAALGTLGLDLLEGAIATRHRLVERYRANLRQIAAIRFQNIAPADRTTYNYFAIVCEHGRDEVAERLTQAGIQSKKYFLPAHLQDAYRGYDARSLPATNRLYEQILCLPLFNELTIEQVDEVCELVVETYTRSGGLRLASGW